MSWGGGPLGKTPFSSCVTPNLSQWHTVRNNDKAVINQKISVNQFFRKSNIMYCDLCGHYTTHFSTFPIRQAQLLVKKQTEMQMARTTLLSKVSVLAATFMCLKWRPAQIQLKIYTPLLTFRVQIRLGNNTWCSSYPT